MNEKRGRRKEDGRRWMAGSGRRKRKDDRLMKEDEGKDEGGAGRKGRWEETRTRKKAK